MYELPIHSLVPLLVMSISRHNGANSLSFIFFGLDLQSIIIPASTCNLCNRRGLSSYIHLEGQFSFPRILSFIAYYSTTSQSLLLLVCSHLPDFIPCYLFLFSAQHSSCPGKIYVKENVSDEIKCQFRVAILHTNRG